MSWLAKLGAAIGREAVESIDLKPIVHEAMAKEFERLATTPKYSHCADLLRRFAMRARTHADNRPEVVDGKS